MATHDPVPVEEFDYEALPPDFSLAANLAAGAFAGIAEHCVMYPVDAIKTRMQIINPSPAAVYTGISNAFSSIYAREGPRTFFKGISSVALGAGPAHAVYFATYEAVKQAMGGNVGHAHHPLATAVGGSCATIASDAIMNPFDVIKQRMQVHGSVFRSISQCAMSVYRTEGLAAFYVSYPTTLSMTIPFTAIQFTSYESISKVINPSQKYDPATHIVSGGLAGAFAAGITTPLDVVKTLLQTRGTAQDLEIRKARGLWEAASLVHRRDGMKGFFRGLRPRIVTAMPSTAICWTAYEMAKAYFIRQRRESNDAI
ncbi:MAG: asparaginyl-tRNA synthetase [Caeruleum heppii]|nr:MAG: asparaginyl-tRNA synthetase [Caeruleum heppii]